MWGKTMPRRALSVFSLCALVGSASLVCANELVRGEAFIEAVAGEIRNIDTGGLRKLAEDHADLMVVDVRMGDEIAALGGMLDTGYRTININRGWLEFRIRESVPDPNTPIVVYCGINQRSPLAAATLMRMGYKHVYNYADGFFAWRDAGLPVRLVDEAPGTMLYRRPMKVADGIWSAIGATAPPTYENSGHNNNLSFIITGAGVVVVNAGDSYLLAQALHREIKQHTKQPVRYVILENGQGHAMLGSNYWQSRGAQVVAHRDAAAEIAEHGYQILDRMQLRNRDKAMGTALTAPDILFDDEYIIELGGMRIEARYLGPAHSRGDIVVWLPQRKIAIAGDIAFHERLLPVFEDTDTAAWVRTWDAFAGLGANVIVPGHGRPTDMVRVEQYTVGYLRYMREEIGKLIERDATLQEAYAVDQSAYAHLDTFDELARLNAGRIFRSMEFE